MTEVWNDAFETTPAGSNAVAVVDDRIRELKVDIRERMQVEHNFSTHGGGTDDGTHKEGECGVIKIAATADIAALTDVANAIAFDTDLYQFKTNGGAGWTVRTPVPTSFPTVVYADEAQTGWELDDTLDDKVLFVSKGSAAGGETGGGAHSTGSWTQPDHTHTGPSHNHQYYAYGAATAHDVTYSSAGNPLNITDAQEKTSDNRGFNIVVASTTPAADYYTNNGGTGNTGASATANTWRPAAYCFTVQSKL